MNVIAVLMPQQLSGEILKGKTAVVFDVLRATTTMIAAFAAGIGQIQAFADLDEARAAAARQNPRPLLIGEINALPAPGADLGNSPRQFNEAHRGRDLIMSTTNGTKALNASREAAAIFIGAIVNATATAGAAANAGRDVVLLGSGTAGEISLEDTIGTGAVCDALLRRGYQCANDVARIARRLFLQTQENLPAALRDGQGGHNVIRAGLEPDIDFAARLDAFDIVGQVDPHNLIIRRF